MTFERLGLKNNKTDFPIRKLNANIKIPKNVPKQKEELLIDLPI